MALSDKWGAVSGCGSTPEWVSILPRKHIFGVSDAKCTGLDYFIRSGVVNQKYSLPPSGRNGGFWLDDFKKAC